MKHIGLPTLLFLLVVAAIVAFRTGASDRVPERRDSSLAMAPLAKARPQPKHADVLLPSPRETTYRGVHGPIPETDAEFLEPVGMQDLQMGQGIARGQIRDSAGHALQDAVVTLLCGSGVQRSLFSDVRGGYEFRGIPAGEYTVLCEYFPKEGTCITGTCRGKIEHGETRTADIVLESGGAGVLSGRVMCDVDPGVALLVRVLSRGSPIRATATVRPDGGYEIRGLPVGPARVRVLTAGESEVVLLEQSLEITAALDFHPQVRLKGRVDVKLVVLTHDGQPVPNADVIVQGDHVSGRTQTGVDGAAVLHWIQPGSYTAYAKLGHLTTSSRVTLFEGASIRLQLP